MPFDPGAILWVKAEIFLTILGFVLLAAALLLPKDDRVVAALLALAGIAMTATFVAGYFPGVPLPGPKAGEADLKTPFPDAIGQPGLFGDGFALILKLIVLAGGALTVLLSIRSLAVEGVAAAEFYALLAFAMVGMLLMASGADFATLYVGLETMALASYALVGYTRRNPKSNEAALKYFLLGAFASGVLLFGISLVFGATGSFHLSGIAAAVRQPEIASSPFLGIGALLILVGLAFKVAAVPFHMWAPDAYEGAPTPVAAFLSTASKAAAFAMLLRVVLAGFLPVAAAWTPMLALLAAASMIVGNVSALRQDNVKRMLAYSSIAHAGYILMAVLVIAASHWEAANRRYALTASVLYLIVYTVTNMGAFGLVAALERGGNSGDTVADFRGLSKTNPLAAAAMVVFLLSLAGIPCTAGFIGKWWLFGAAVRSGFTWLAVVAVVNSAVSLYYYARIAVAMYMTPAEDESPRKVAFGTAAALWIAAVLTLVIGVYPQPFIVLAQLARMSTVLQ